MTHLEHGGGGDGGVSEGVGGAEAAGLEGPLGEAGAEGVQQRHYQTKQLHNNNNTGMHVMFKDQTLQDM